MTLSRKNPRAKQRWTLLAAVVGALTLLVAGLSLGLSSSNFELDKNANHDLTSTHLGGLKTSVDNKTTTTSFVVCELGAAPPTPFEIQIDAERMQVNSIGASATTGGCSFANPLDVATSAHTWNVTRAFDSTSIASHVGGPPRNDVTRIQTASGHDWDQVYTDHLNNTTNGVTDCSDIGAAACVWKNRPNTGTAVAPDFSGPTTFTGTSGDTQLISQWKWTNQSVPDADEINDAFAAKYSGTTQDLYVGMDRYAVNGSKDIGFWFFHEAVSPNADGTFSGAHCYAGQATAGCGAPTHGDLLLLTTFSAGGGTTTARAYEWVGNGPGAATSSDGPLNFLGSFGDCAAGINSSTPGCATTANTTVPAPWTHQEKPTGASANLFYAGGFMEGGIDLTVLGETGCFASFMGTSRASPSLTAQPKAFILGGFEQCTAANVTTPEDSSGTSISGGSVPIGSTGTVQVKDLATVTGGGSSTKPTGSVRFYICGPATTNALAQCNAATTPLPSPPTFPTGPSNGTLVSTNALTPDGGNSSTATSDLVTISAAGHYCFRGDYSGDSLYPESSDNSLTECFTVTPLTPTIATQVKNTNGTVDTSDDTNVTAPIPVGTTVYDTSTLSGSTTNAGGTVRYRIYTDNTCGTLLGGTAGNAFNTQTDKAVTNASPGNSDSITLNTAGTFYFQATYQTGDTNNVAGAMSTCSSEAVTVQATPAPHSTPAIEIKDTITVSGLSASPSGNLVVGIYTNSACTTRLSGTSDVTFAIGSGPFNTDFVGPLGSGTYFYKLSYAGDTFNTGFSDCTEEVNATITSLP